MKTYTGVSIGSLPGIVLLCVMLIGPCDDAAAQAVDRLSGERGGNFLGLPPDQAEELRRRIESTVRERGTLQSADNAEIRGNVQSQTTVVRIVPEGTVVQEGELLVELDDSSLREEAIAQRAAVAQAQAILQQTELALAAARRERDNTLAVAEAAVKVAVLNRERYLGKGGEFDLEVKKIENEMVLADTKLEVAQTALKRAEQAVEKGVADRGAVDEMKMVAAEARAALETGAATKRLLTGHLRAYRAAALELAILEADSAVTQIRIQSEAATNKVQAELLGAKAALELEEVKLAAIERQIENCRILAPRDGLVIASKEPASRLSPGPVEEGSAVRQRQLLLTMPDMSRLQVRLTVNESRIGRVRKGQTVRIQFNALHDRTFRGKVSHVAEYPQPTSYWRGDVKEFAVLVSLEDPTPEMKRELKLGMTAVGEIDVSQPDRQSP